MDSIEHRKYKTPTDSIKSQPNYYNFGWDWFLLLLLFLFLIGEVETCLRIGGYFPSLASTIPGLYALDAITSSQHSYNY